MRIILFAFLTIASLRATSQDCGLVLKGIVSDVESNEALIGAAIWVEEISSGEITDVHGEFVIPGLCPGTYTLTIHYLGYGEKIMQLKIKQDEVIAIGLESEDKILDEVTIATEANRFSDTRTTEVAKTRQLDQAAGKPFAESLSGITGVNLLRTGPTILKPVIHGLHSNRILILNNGIRQEGQQWGSEHAPEIDPFMASSVTVVKGAEAVKYGSDAIAGLILVEPPELHRNADFGGEVSFGGMSNSLTGFISGLLEGNIGPVDGLSWRVQGTMKRAGDSRAPDYVLSNTGLSEYNLSGTLGYQKGKVTSELYYSRFKTELGILSASHVGNLADLEEALQSPVPLIIEPFTFDINNPRQDVTHNLVKASANIDLGNNEELSIKYGGQINRRKEFDKRRGGRETKPAIDMKLNTHSMDVIFEHRPLGNIVGEIGTAFTYQANRNVEGTGVEPLIPYYDQFTGGIFAVEKYVGPRWEAELGARFDYRSLKVKDFDAAGNLVTPEYKFGNLSLTGGGSYAISESFSIRSNIGTAWRQPNVAELFSRGLHHGAAAIEEGLLIEDGDLVGDVGNAEVIPEKSYKWVTTAVFNKKKFSLEGSFYINWINDFIYLEPSPGEYRLTIRGAFPVFRYQQTNANLTGFDGGMEWNFAGPLSLDLKGSVLRGWNTTADEYLIWMPADRIESAIHFDREEWLGVQNFHLSVGMLSVSRQYKAPADADFTAPPSGYSLFNVHAGFSLPIGNNSLGIYLNVDNVLNTSYRDYMNRFRYYADDLGRNFTIKLKYDFHSH